MIHFGVNKYSFMKLLTFPQRQKRARKRFKLATLLNQSLLLKQWTSPQRFKLIRYFSLASLSAFVIATALIAFVNRQREVRNLVIFAEENNVALTQIFSNTLWQEYGSFLSSTQALSNDELATDPRIERLYEAVLTQFEGLSVAKVKVYDLQGRTVFSTDLSQIGENKRQSSGFLTARSGQVLSQLGHRDTFEALQSTLEDRHLLSSYIPIRGASGDISGVFELYTDVTPLLQHINQTQRDIILGSFLILAALYGALFLLIQRADTLLRKQYQQLQKSEGRYRDQARELKQVLTELRQTQAQVVQSEKMSSLGQLVAGVAHEINNPVNFIHGNLAHVQEYAQDLLGLLQMYRHHYPQPAAEIQAAAEVIELDFIQDDLPKTLSSMKLGTSRICEIVLSLRNFSRLDESEIKPVNLHEGLDSTLVILNHRLKAGAARPAIQVIREYGVLPPVECYAGLLNQVFMNLLSNAVDALDEGMKARSLQARQENPGQITLRTSLIKDEWVQIAIADNGPGISSDLQSRIFDPFFTTKGLGKGTGMGLSISHQIVTEKHHGQLECCSTPGQGTEFVIRLPLRQDSFDQ
ncbi:MAG: HAMP domain-containing histidine kinase [Leptolyngbya sp. SIO1E4]|nr:HAMP domain-containing histidine kinase [Leptolyngbya sp. SIO1E4]